MPVDIHAHYLSEQLVAEARSGSSRLPVEMFKNESGLELLRVGDARTGIIMGPWTPGLYDIKLRRADMDSVGVTRQILSPMPVAMGMTLSIEDALSIQDMHHDEILDLSRTDSDHFGAMAVLPMQDVDLAIKRLGQLVGRGFTIFQIGTNVLGVDLDDPRFRPFFAAVQEADATLMIHPISGRWGALMPGYSLPIVLGVPLESALCFARLVYSGVFDEFPDLRICWTHLGGNLPIVRGRLDSAWQEREENHHSKLQPSEYLARCWFDTMSLYADGIRFACETIGADRIVLGSDYPGDVGDHDPVARVQGSGISEKDVARILDGNIEALLTGMNNR